ncbi:MAG: YggS family pyridoxal phosphate-dependent enzyme, partial [Bacillota bacterium]
MNRPLIRKLQSRYPDVRIVMASKYLEAHEFDPYIRAGIRDFGESRVEAFMQKYEALKDEAFRWHFLGTLQSKKVKKMINQIDVLHSLDHMRLAKEIDKRRDKVLPCFVQVNISEEPQKHGVPMDKVKPFIDEVLAKYKTIKVVGLMGMAENTNHKDRIRRQFSNLRELRDQIRKSHPTVEGLSMGMSQDYEMALEEGATTLRLGRVLISEELL